MNTHTVYAGQCAIGGGHPLSVQTMCTTDTLDVETSLAQCTLLANSGAQLIRLTTQGSAQVEALSRIKAGLRASGIDTPLVADVHFSARVAIEAAKVAEKVRINPGNFSPDPSQARDLLLELIHTCKEHHTALRIGVNHGSLSARVMEAYGDTPYGMAQGAMEYLCICRDAGFDQVVVSLKSSNTRVMVQAYRELAGAMEQEHMHFPLHLGITEAGNGRQGRLKSAAGLFTLLQEGLGDTLRISLTEPPLAEVLFGLKLSREYDLYCGDKNYSPQINTWDDLILAACWKWAPGLINQTIDYKNLEIPFVEAPFATKDELTEFCMDLLQATRCVFTKPEYIACPGCGRTKYNLEETLQAVKAATSHLKGCTIAVMGCIVNGPGEMADADYGYVGEGGSKITLYKGKTPVMRGIPQEEAVQRLLELIASQQK